MDALSDALRVMGLTGGVFLEATFTAPGCRQSRIGPDDCRPYLSSPTDVICFHFIVEGHCKAGLDGQPPCELRAGDVVILPHNDPHLMGSDLALKPTPSKAIVQPGNGS